MRCYLDKNAIKHFNRWSNQFQNESEENIKKYLKEEIIEYYYNGFLYGSDDVLINIKKFLKNPSELNFKETAISMRKDL